MYKFYVLFVNSYPGWIEIVPLDYWGYMAMVSDFPDAAISRKISKLARVRVARGGDNVGGV